MKTGNFLRGGCHRRQDRDNHRNDDPTRSDSVVLCVDALASWKQFMKDYTLGAFRIVMVSADGNSPATATFQGQPFGEIRKVVSKRTDKG